MNLTNHLFPSCFDSKFVNLQKFFRVLPRPADRVPTIRRLNCTGQNVISILLMVISYIPIKIVTFEENLR